MRVEILTTWLIEETFDWRMVTASPIEGFLLMIAEDLKPLAATLIMGAILLALDTNFDNILLLNNK